MNVRKLRDVPRYGKTFIYRVDTWFELCFYLHRSPRPWRFIVLSHMYIAHISLFSPPLFFFSPVPISIYSPTVHEYSYDFFFPRVVVKYLAVRSLCAVKLARTTVASIPFVNPSFFLSSSFSLLFRRNLFSFFAIRRWNGFEGANVIETKDMLPRNESNRRDEKV